MALGFEKPAMVTEKKTEIGMGSKPEAIGPSFPVHKLS